MSHQRNLWETWAARALDLPQVWDYDPRRSEAGSPCGNCGYRESSD